MVVALVAPPQPASARAHATVTSGGRRLGIAARRTVIRVKIVRLQASDGPPAEPRSRLACGDVLRRIDELRLGYGLVLEAAAQLTNGRRASLSRLPGLLRRGARSPPDGWQRAIENRLFKPSVTQIVADRRRAVATVQEGPRPAGRRECRLHERGELSGSTPIGLDTSASVGLQHTRGQPPPGATPAFVLRRNSTAGSPRDAVCADCREVGADRWRPSIVRRARGGQQVDRPCLPGPPFPTAQASFRPSGRCRILRRTPASSRVPPRRQREVAPAAVIAIVAI